MKASQKRRKTELKKLEIERQREAGAMRKRHQQILERFVDDIRPRVGTTPKEKLKWVLKVLSKPPQTPGDWENFQLEIAVFCGEMRAAIGKPDVPTEQEASRIREDFKSIIQKLVERKPIETPAIEYKLVWFPTSKIASITAVDIEKIYRARRGEYVEPDVAGHYTKLPARHDWHEIAKDELCELILDAGHLIRACKATVPRSDKRCGTWFVANRPDKIYCSSQCMSRAATKAWRKPNAK